MLYTSCTVVAAQPPIYSGGDFPFGGEFSAVLHTANTLRFSRDRRKYYGVPDIIPYQSQKCQPIFRTFSCLSLWLQGIMPLRRRRSSGNFIIYMCFFEKDREKPLIKRLKNGIII